MSDAVDGEIEGFLRAHGSFEKPPLFPDGEQIGDWKVLAFLGRGGSAEVYRAENVVTGIVGALKVLFRADDSSRVRFRRETRLVAETKSAAFPMFYGAGECDGRLYIAEELLEPSTLPSVDADVARFILGIAEGVEELHRRGFIHRDLKPGNVLVRPSTGEHVLIDMGLAKESEETPQTRNETVSVIDGHAVGVGTPGYSAPEQFTGGKIGVAMDIHALGMLANACLGGKPPKVWSAIIRRSTSSIPEQRYATVADFARAVRRRHAARWWIVAIAAAIVALVATLVAVDTITQVAKDGKPQTAKTDAPQGVRHDTKTAKNVADEVLEAVLDACYGGIEKTAGHVATNANIVSRSENSLLDLGKTTYEHDVAVTRITLNGQDVSLSGEVKLTGKRKIEIIGPGRLMASITGSHDVRLELGEQAVLVNLSTNPYPESSMRYILNGACYLNFKNLDPPQDLDFKNIWVDDFEGKGIPSFRFRGPDSYAEVRKEDKKAALDVLRKGIMPSY